MKTLRVIVLLCLALAAGTVFAGRYDTVQYECDHFDAKRDGLRCMILYSEGDGLLFIRVYPKAKESVEFQKRRQYLMNTTIHNFTAYGGSTVNLRAPIGSGTFKAEVEGGKMKEWYCSRPAHAGPYAGVVCNAFHDPYPSWAKYWKPLEQ